MIFFIAFYKDFYTGKTNIGSKKLYYGLNVQNSCVSAGHHFAMGRV